MPSLEQTLKYLYGLESLGIRPGLERIRRLLSLLDDPHNAYPSILVGGTNGKGSTSSMVASILKEAGHRTALYTSPHLLRFNERIRVDGKEITGREITRLVDRLKPLAEDVGDMGCGRPSFFEFTTALAFEYFREKEVDIAVVEVGMGGRFDATNVVRPFISIITNVAVDHTQYLGTSIRDIAYEKAGIIRDGAMVVAGRSDEEALRVIEKVAGEKGARLYLAGRDFRVEPDGEYFNYFGWGAPLKGLCLSLGGPHQLANAGCALKAVELVALSGRRVEEKDIRRGLERTLWPGRLEVVGRRPTVVLDCAHNAAGARALRAALGGFGCRSIVLVLGIMADKDIRGIMAELVPLARTVVLTEPAYRRSAGTDKLLDAMRDYKGRVIVRKRVASACRAALEDASMDDMVCIAGSIFTVAEAKRYFSARARRSL